MAWRMKEAPEIIAQPPCATEIMASTGLVSRETAYQLLRCLATAGFVVAPREPTNSMFDAYMTALRQPPQSRRSVICNIGKARHRWKAMATEGMKVAFSRKGKTAAPAYGIASEKTAGFIKDD